MSGSLQSHGLWPTRFLCPWDFPGRETLLNLLKGVMSILKWLATMCINTSFSVSSHARLGSAGVVVSLLLEDIENN